MTDKETLFMGIVIAIIIIGFLYSKMILIWRDVMQEQHKKNAEQLKIWHKIKNRIK